MEIKKILFYGQGNGRDHASHISAITSKEIEAYSIILGDNALMESCNNVIKVKNYDEALKLIKKIQPDLIVVNNRIDLSNGVAEKLEKEGFKVFGISSDVSRLETSKDYAKKFMLRNNIRTPNYFVANNQQEAIDFINNNWSKSKYGYVFKVDQFSRNSFERTAVPQSLEDAINNIYRLFGSTSNAKLIIEEKIIGYELSLHVMIKNNKYSILPMVQDYKKKYPKNEGPMTAGTASVATTIQCPVELYSKLKNEIIEPTISGFIKEKIKYNYILYIGIMITPDGIPYVLEYNTRSGNPEWLALLGLLKIPLSDYLALYYSDIEKLKYSWKKDINSVAIYGFSAGYPETERSIYNEEIMFLEQIKKDTTIIGEHITLKNQKLYPDGGRVFALRRTGTDFNKIKEDLFDDFYKVKMNGLFFRNDITSIEYK